jgi:hypothetical protein
LRDQKGEENHEDSDRVPTFKAFCHSAPGSRFVWLIPADTPKSHTYYTRLAGAQREAVARRARDGEGRTALGCEYGVTCANT